MKEDILPRGIYISKRRPDKFAAQYWNKDLKTTIYIGQFDTIEEAIIARDKYIVSVYEGLTDDSIPKTKELPKGIWETSSGSYGANIQVLHGKNKLKHAKIHIGSYKTIDEAVEKRKEFILKLL